MINDRFNEERQARLSARLKRYLSEFSRCSSAWMEQSLLPSHSSEVASIMQLAMHQVSGGEIQKMNGTLLDTTQKAPLNQATPPCMESLEMSMSLERDEWMSTKEDSLSGLFMPFANLHTQVQALLTDYPSMTNLNMNWQRQARSSAAEYGSFLTKSLLDAWKIQVCRTVRLRHSKDK